MASLRPPAVAGMFYPGEPRALAREVDELLDEVELYAPRLRIPKVLIVPHAGYVYSGRVAAAAYDELAPARGIIRRVVLLGPVHRVAVRGLATPGVDAFATPLGEVPIDRAALRAVEDHPQVITSAPAHAMEHSLEVQLPFLQKCLGSFELVPLAVGAATVDEVGRVLEKLWGGQETLIVISTDLSHYLPYAQAREIDQRTLARIVACETDIHHDEACGATPLNGVLALARSRRLEVRPLAACNSGDTAGGKERVVGYASLALYEEAAPSPSSVGERLVLIAREAIEQALFSKGCSSFDDAWLQRPAASFVTLRKAGELRGCIGSLHATRPLALDVAQNALCAGFRDPRFPALSADEWPRCEIEVSLLSAAKRLRFGDEEELVSQLRPGEDGLVLEADGRRSTFLPQVWEIVPDRRAFLRELVRKAGLPDDTRLTRCTVSRYRVMRFHGRPVVA